MHAKEAIMEVIRRFPGITQMRLADESSVNRGQLSTWLSKDGPLSEEKQASVVSICLKLLAEELESDPNAATEDFTQCREALEAFPPYQRFRHDTVEAVLGHPVSPANPAYVRRKAEDELEDRLRLHKLWLAVIGGPGMGKSSMLLFARQQIDEAGGLTFYLNCDDYAILREKNAATPDLLSWLARTCERGIKGSLPVHLGSTRLFSSWLERNVLANAGGRPCTFLFDQVERLWEPGAEDEIGRVRAFRQLLIALHNLQNDTSERPHLEAVHFLVAWDRAHIALANAQREVSSVNRYLQYIRLETFPENHVRRLIERLIPNSEIATRTAETAWANFRGHPLLTQVWIQEQLAHLPAGETFFS